MTKAEPTQLEKWLTDLESEDLITRAQAASALLETGYSQAIEPLIHHLQSDPEPAIKRQIAGQLGFTGDRRAVEPLLVVLSSPEPEIRAGAAYSLGLLGDVRAIEPLAQLLKDASQNVREWAAIGLASLGDPRAFATLIGLLRHIYQQDSPLDGKDASFVTMLLAKIAPATLPALTELILDPDPVVQESVISALTAAGEPGLEVLLAAYSQLGLKGSIVLIGCLSGTPHPKVTVFLISLLHHEDATIRQEAAQALGKSGDPAGVAPLVALLADETEPVVLAAIAALGELGNKMAVEPLLKLLENTPASSSQLRWLIQALGRLGDQRTVGPLSVLLENDQGELSSSLASTLVKLGPAGLPELVRHLYQNPYPRVRQELAWSLGYAGSAGVAPLIKALGDQDQEVRYNAVQSLARLKDEGSVQPLIEILLNDPAGTVRYKAAEALGELGLATAIEPLEKTVREDTGTGDFGIPVRQAAREAVQRLRLSNS